VLEEPPAPLGNPPFGCRLAHCLSAAWAFELPPKPPEPPKLGGVPPEPPELGGVPPEKPDGGPPLDPPREGNFSPCLDRHAWKAENDFALDGLCLALCLAAVRSVAAPLVPLVEVVRARVVTRERAQSPKSAPRRSPRAGVPRRERRVVFIGSECDRRTCDADPGNSRVS